MALTGAHAGHWMLHVSQSSFRVGAPGIHRRNLKCSLLPNGWWNKHIWLLTFFARKIWLRSHFQIYRLCDVCLIAALISVVSELTPLFECEEAQGRHSARSSFLQPTEAGRRIKRPSVEVLFELIRFLRGTTNKAQMWISMRIWWSLHWHDPCTT